MVGGERCEPVHRQIMGPDEEDGYVDGEHPEHEDQHRVRVVVEIIMGARSLSDVRSLVYPNGFIRSLQFPELIATPVCRWTIVQGLRLGRRIDTE